jgi:hypothetical protein
LTSASGPTARNRAEGSRTYALSSSNVLIERR